MAHTCEDVDVEIRHSEGEVQDYSRSRSSSASAATLLQFPDPSVRRATPLGAVLCCGGHVLGCSGGSEETYQLSRPVERIDTFISHNWSVSRFRKHAILILHFNFNKAVIATAVAFIIYNAMSYHHKDVLLKMPSVIMCLTFVVFLWFGHHLDCIFHCQPSGRFVFLDKTCIHQTDPVLMRNGIEKLTAFVAHSSHFLVCYSEVYLKKLWTVYEMATVLILGRSEDMRIIPVMYPLVVVTFLFCAMLRFAVTFILKNKDHGDSSLDQEVYELITHIIVVTATAGPCTYLMMLWHRNQRDAVAAAATFDIRKARCAVDADRPLVLQNCLALMRHEGLAQKDTSDDEVLDAFNELVRTTLPRAFTASVGRNGFPYKILLLFGLIGDNLDDVSAALGKGTKTPVTAAFDVAAFIGTAFCWLPLMVATVARLENRFHHRFWTIPRLFIWVFVELVMYILAAPESPSRTNLMGKLHPDHIRLVVMCLYTLVLAIITRIVFIPEEQVLVAKHKFCQLNSQLNLKESEAIRGATKRLSAWLQTGTGTGAQEPSVRDCMVSV